MKIAIAGAGAMGSRFGLMLTRAGFDVVLIDGWAAHVAEISAHGLTATFNGTEMTVPMPILKPEEISKNLTVDLVIVFTKAMQLEPMMQALVPMLHEKTEVLCLLNGIGHEDVISKYVDPARIFIGNTMWTAELIGPGHVKLMGDGHVNLQNLVVGAENEAAAKKIASLLTQAGLDGRYAANIREAIYLKACINGTMNGLCTLLDCNMNQLGATHTAHSMVGHLVAEFAAVAQKEGIHLDVTQVVAEIESLYDPANIGNHYPSMYQDLVLNHRLTEIDYINGAISRKGRKYDVATPYCDFLTELIHAEEDLLVD